MNIPKKIEKLLSTQKVKFEIIKHKTVFTAFDKAKTLKLPERIIGKTVVVKKDKELFLFLIPANKDLDFRKVKSIVGKNAKLAKEKEIENKIKGVKLGAIPPFGNLWNITTFADRSLKREKKIVINGGNWNFSIRISPRELEKIVPLTWGSFSKKRK